MLKNRFRSHTRRIVLLSICICIVFCGGQTEEDLILETMDKVGRFAEAKDVANIMHYIAEDYIDFKGRNKQQTQGMLQNYFSHYQGIVVHKLGTRISYVSLPEASFQMDVLVSSGGAKLFRKMVKYAGDLYRIKGELVKEGNMWKIQYAEWEWINLEELFPESFSILKKIFPNL